LRPARYPDSRAVEHIHPVIKEPGISEYWIDEFVFADDPYLDKNERKGIERGGSGIITLREQNGVLYGERNIYLGLNVPGYPPAKSK
jgi:protocatechuate 3,4-dioxygenase beta subunit